MLQRTHEGVQCDGLQCSSVHGSPERPWLPRNSCIVWPHSVYVPQLLASTIVRREKLVGTLGLPGFYRYLSTTWGGKTSCRIKKAAGPR